MRIKRYMTKDKGNFLKRPKIFLGIYLNDIFKTMFKYFLLIKLALSYRRM